MIDVRGQFVLPQGHATNNPAALQGIAIHHSVTRLLPVDAPIADEMAVLKAIQAYHLSDEVDYGLFAYHFAAFPSGRIYWVGDILGQRAHVWRRNHELVGIVAIGTFTLGLPGLLQMRALGEGIDVIRRSVNRPSLLVQGHNTWAVPGGGTGCAGKLNAITPREWDEIAAAASGEEGADMPNGLWVECSNPLQGVPYRTWVLFTTPEGMKRYYVRSLEEHNALLATGIAGDKPKPVSRWSIKMFSGPVDPDQP